MREKTKLAWLIIFNTVTTLIGYLIEYFKGYSEEISPAEWIIIFVWFLGHVVFGFITENLRQLLLFSFISALVSIIFVFTDSYYVPAKYAEILEIFGNSIVMLTVFFFIFAFLISFILLGIGMLFSFAYKAVFKK